MAITLAQIEQAEGKRVRVTDHYGDIFEGTCTILSPRAYVIHKDDGTTVNLRTNALIAGEDKLVILA